MGRSCMFPSLHRSLRSLADPPPLLGSAKITAQAPTAEGLTRSEEGQRGPLDFEFLLARLHDFGPTRNSNPPT